MSGKHTYCESVTLVEPPAPPPSLSGAAHLILEMTLGDDALSVPVTKDADALRSHGIRAQAEVAGPHPRPAGGRTRAPRRSLSWPLAVSFPEDQSLILAHTSHRSIIRLEAYPGQSADFCFEGMSDGAFQN